MHSQIKWCPSRSEYWLQYSKISWKAANEVKASMVRDERYLYCTYVLFFSCEHPWKCSCANLTKMPTSIELIMPDDILYIEEHSLFPTGSFEMKCIWVWMCVCLGEGIVCMLLAYSCACLNKTSSNLLWGYMQYILLLLGCKDVFGTSRFYGCVGCRMLCSNNTVNLIVFFTLFLFNLHCIFYAHSSWLEIVHCNEVNSMCGYISLWLESNIYLQPFQETIKRENSY